jgi:hypothetical protein
MLVVTLGLLCLLLVVINKWLFRDENPEHGCRGAAIATNQLISDNLTYVLYECDNCNDTWVVDYPGLWSNEHFVKNDESEGTITIK